MEEKNELNDIILNKDSGVNGNKKILLVVATLGVILIIVVMLMNSLTSNGTDNLPKAILPPEPKALQAQQEQEEPLFEDVAIVEEKTKENDDLDNIAQRLKKESQAQVVSKKKPTQAKPVTPRKPATVKKVVQKKVQAKKVAVKTIKSTSDKAYYIQVGSFSKYEPDKRFLKSITDKGFNYQYYKVTKNAKTLNKVLVGPFDSEIKARNALRTVRSSIESGAFLIKI